MLLSILDFADPQGWPKIRNPAARNGSPSRISHGGPCLLLPWWSPELYEYSQSPPNFHHLQPSNLLWTLFSTLLSLSPRPLSLSGKDSRSLLSAHSPRHHSRPRFLRRFTFVHSVGTSISTMAPTIQVPAEDTLKTLQNVLKRRIDSNRILKEREKQMLSGEDYRLMEVDLNNKQFLQPLDADNTKASIYYIRQKFIRYTCNT